MTRTASETRTCQTNIGWLVDALSLMAGQEQSWLVIGCNGLFILSASLPNGGSVALRYGLLRRVRRGDFHNLCSQESACTMDCYGSHCYLRVRIFFSVYWPGMLIASRQKNHFQKKGIFSCIWITWSLNSTQVRYISEKVRFLFYRWKHVRVPGG